MERIVDIQIKKPTGLFHPRTGEELGLRIVVFQILGNLPRIGDNRAVVPNDRHPVLLGKSQFVLIAKANRERGIVQALIA